jgi:hypothetical protein
VIVTDKILDRVKKLLSLSNSDNEFEAANAASRAHELLLKYNLSIADVGDGISEDELKIEEELVHEGGRVARWRTYLVSGVAKAFGCAQLVSKGYRYTGLKIVGAKADIAVAKVTLSYLEMVVETLAKENARGMGHGYVNSYKIGLVARLTARLHEQTAKTEREVVAEASEVGTAMVIRKKTDLRDFMSQFTKKYNPGKSTINNAGYGAGVKDAENVGLNRQLGAKKAKTKWGMSRIS